MKTEHYGLIVIGAGMAGLSTALAWLKVHDPAESPVLILEKEPAAGGCVTTFSRDSFRFDTVQIIPDISDLLSFFEVDLPLHRYEPDIARLFLADPAAGRARVYNIPSGIEEFKRSLILEFPDEVSSLERFFRQGQAMLDELVFLKTEPTIPEGLHILRKCPGIIRNSRKTYSDYLEGFQFQNPLLLEILDSFSSFSALSGDRCAALLTACAMMTTLQGSYRPTGGFIGFAHTLIKKIKEKGGHVRFNTAVDRIITDHGKIRGVLAGNELISCDHVVSTADTFNTFDSLLGQDILKQSGKGYFRKYLKTVPSPSSFTIHLGLDDRIDLQSMGFNCGYNILTTGRQAHEEAFRCWDRQEYLRRDDCFHLAVISPSAVIGGRNTLIVHVTPAAMADWESLRKVDKVLYDLKKLEWAEFYIRKVEQYMIPGLQSHILFKDVATPATYARYLGSRKGANSDMLSVPGNFGMYRLRSRTPVKGLFIPKFSHGIWPSLQAGLQMVDMMTGGKIMGGRSRYIDEQ